MRTIIRILLLPTLYLFLAGACAPSTQQEKTLHYPRKPMDNPERRSGPAMLFYEAAEKDADPANIIVTPPAEDGKQTAP